jgi:hypothetical protein
MAKTSTQTLVLLASSELRADQQELDRLTRGVIENMTMMRRLRGEEALRGLLVGMMLHRVKHSLPHGQFGPWIRANVHDFGDRYVNYLMRLSLAFIDKAKVNKPELLALPGEQVELALEGKEGAQRRFLEKAVKFVGELSLNELLIKHGIKSVGLKTELMEGEGDQDDELTPEQRAQYAREQAWLETWTAAQQLRASLTEPDKISLITEPQHLEQLKAEVVELNKLVDERLAILRAVKV